MNESLFNHLWQVFVFIMLLQMTMSLNNKEWSKKEDKIPFVPNLLFSMIIMGLIALGIYGGYTLSELSKKLDFHIEWKAE